MEEEANESHRLNLPNRGERLDEGIGLGVGYGPLDPVAGSSSERDVVGSPGAPEPVGTVAGGLMDSRDLRDLVRGGTSFSAAIPTSFPAGFPPPSVDAIDAITSNFPNDSKISVSGQIAQSSPVHYGEAGPNGSVEPMHGRASRDGLGGELGVGPKSDRPIGLSVEVRLILVRGPMGQVSIPMAWLEDWMAAHVFVAQVCSHIVLLWVLQRVGLTLGVWAVLKLGFVSVGSRLCMMDPFLRMVFPLEEVNLLGLDWLNLATIICPKNWQIHQLIFQQMAPRCVFRMMLSIKACSIGVILWWVTSLMDCSLSKWCKRLLGDSGNPLVSLR
ncbi:uncharacterized protein LOC127810667 [Diospyros lotus]|uniref:uncharacterized protein LOC127810667 n=1 Tax=Diospyros lotus TaxID=55363 RepID=UPI00224D8C2E|nr:uncharacterized protein LOC127810667 [Diospyros lotus]XP_052206211.1 uncharacterized protein LOC127810667 [Diospyros lotus]